jgi:putative nucleotidyltransferase with HDIG domain
MTARLGHLVRRFFAVLRARPLSPAEQAEAAALLRRAEGGPFWAQPVADQRHALEAARIVAGLAPGRRDLARAALLHDIGKRHARLGIVGRSLASGLELVGLPAPGRLGRYLAHGPEGAAELEALGAEPIVVAFARHHHGEPPAGIDRSDWAALAASDEP